MRPDPLSSTLFIIVLDEALRSAFGGFPKVFLNNNVEKSALSYAVDADDLVIFANPPPRIAVQIKRTVSAPQRTVSSFQKCKSAHLVKHKALQQTYVATRPVIKVSGLPIPYLAPEDRYRYL